MRRENLSQIEPLSTLDAEQARRAGLGPLVHWLQGEPSAPDPQSHRFQLEIAECVEAFRQSQVTAVLLKGADLASRAYPRAHMRTMTDIDIWVRATDARGARQVIERLGFNRAPSEATHHWRFMRTGTVVELHFDLFNRPHGLRYDADEVFDRRTTIPLAVDGVEAFVLDPVDAAIHNIGHAAFSDAFNTVTSVVRAPVDVLLLQCACGFSREALWERAEAWGLTAALDVFCELCGEDFPALRDWRPRTHASAWARELARHNHAHTRRNQRTLPASVVRGALAPGWWSSMRVWWSHGARALQRRGRDR